MNKSSHHHRRQLAEWLAERDLDRLLDEPGEKSISATEIRYDRKAGKVEPGLVYILRPAAKSERPWGPVYLVTLELTHGLLWRVVPFGRYAAPAVPGEWSTGMSAPPLRVLCFWNVREISAEYFLPGSAKKMPLKMMNNIRTVYRHILFGEKMDDKLRKQIGPPIQHPADPRYDYLDEERVRLDEHQNRGTGQIIRFDETEVGAVTWRLAAEGRPRYGQADE